MHIVRSLALLASMAGALSAQAVRHYGKCTQNRFGCPSIDAAGTFRMGNFFLVLGGGLRTGRPAVLGLGLKKFSGQLYGVAVNIVPELLFVLPVTGRDPGVAALSVTAPNNPSVIGTYYFQWFQVDPTVTTGVTSSVGLELKISR